MGCWRIPLIKGYLKWNKIGLNIVFNLYILKVWYGLSVFNEIFTLDDKVCFGRLVSMRRILELCISKAKQLLIMKIWIPQKFLKNPFLHDGFSTNVVHKTETDARFIYARFIVKRTMKRLMPAVHLGYTVLKRMPNIKITTKK